MITRVRSPIFQAACWSPKGNILLFATENKPIIYSLTFSEATNETEPVIGGSQTAVACVDLSETDLQVDGEEMPLKYESFYFF